MVGLRAVLGLFFIAGCSTNQTPEPERTSTVTAEAARVKLASSLEVELGAKDVRLVFHITNPTDQPVVLEFTSGQRYDFAVRNASGELWRWSASQMFMQALGTETIPARGSLRYSEVWSSGNRTGSFTATAQLTATNHPIEQRTDFEIRR